MEFHDTPKKYNLLITNVKIFIDVVENIFLKVPSCHFVPEIRVNFQTKGRNKIRWNLIIPQKVVIYYNILTNGKILVGDKMT